MMSQLAGGLAGLVHLGFQLGDVQQQAQEVVGRGRCGGHRSSQLAMRADAVEEEPAESGIAIPQSRQDVGHVLQDVLLLHKSVFPAPQRASSPKV